MFYLVKTPWWIRKIYDRYLWKVKTEEKNLFLTFDDGPHPQATAFVLEQLAVFDARATFFCVGRNVENHPELYDQLSRQGHATGNHTYSHLNGWRSDDKLYLDDIRRASACIESGLFRPPYGKITRFQASNLPAAMKTPQPLIVMWDVVSGDFDETLDGRDCLANVIFNAGPGSIVVFHDSEKAFPRLHYSLPRVLKFFAEKGYHFRSL